MHNYNFHIIGVGASAGGVVALKELVSRLPEGLNAVVVIITHLFAQHRSHLSEILELCTKMPVVRVDHSKPLKPGVIYVLAENRMMTLKDGILKIRGRKVEEKINHAIDIFFESMAVEAGPKAIGVVLSGTNDDGTEGAKAIGNNAGTVMVQDPFTAIHPKMPLAVIIRDDPKVIGSLEDLADAIIKRVVESSESERVYLRRDFDIQGLTG